jgi:hypothetical protein
MLGAASRALEPLHRLAWRQERILPTKCAVLTVIFNDVRRAAGYVVICSYKRVSVYSFGNIKWAYPLGKTLLSMWM